MALILALVFQIYYITLNEFVGVSGGALATRQWRLGSCPASCRGPPPRQVSQHNQSPVIVVADTQATYLPFMLAMYLTATFLANHVPSWLPLRDALGGAPSSLPFGLVVFFNGWFWQFLGHFMFEGRAPALFDNLTQGESEPERRSRAPQVRGARCEVRWWAGLCRAAVPEPGPL